MGDGAFDDAQLCLGGRSVRALVCVGETLDLEASLCVRRFRKLIDGDTGRLSRLCFGRSLRRSRAQD